MKAGFVVKMIGRKRRPGNGVKLRIAFIDASKKAEKYSSIAIDPLALCYLASIAQGKGHKLKLFQKLGEPTNRFLKRILKFKPDVCAFSVFTSAFKDSLQLSAELKKKLNCKTIFGGYHPTGDPLIVKNKAIDFAVIGEGDQTFSELIEVIASNGRYEKIKGIAFKKGNKVVVIRRRERIKDLDSLPLPYRVGLPRYKYKKIGTLPASFDNQKVAAIITSRGCPYDCKFCVSPLLWEREVYFRSPEKIVDEIELLIKEKRVNHIRILDNDFLINKKHVAGICDELLKRNIKVYWDCYGGLRNVSFPLLKKMSQAGCVDIFYGIDSLNQKQLNWVNKQLNINAIKEGLKKTVKAGILPKGAIMIGFPDETEEGLKNTSNMLKELPLDILEVAFITPYPGTKLSGQIKKNQLFTDDLCSFDSQTPVIKTKISKKRLLEWQKKLYAEFYYSPKYRKRMAANIKKRPELSKLYKDLFLWLGRFF